MITLFRPRDNKGLAYVASNPEERRQLLWLGWKPQHVSGGALLLGKDWNTPAGFGLWRVVDRVWVHVGIPGDLIIELSERSYQ